MPIFVVPDSNGEDAAPVRRAREHGDPSRTHLPYPHAGGRPALGSPAERVRMVEERLTSSAERARRANPKMTAEEAADPAFQAMLDKVRNEAETILERQQAVPLARAYLAAAKGMEGYPFPGSILKHAGPVGGLTAERAAVHQQIIDYYKSRFTTPNENPVIVATGGLPGAGKSQGIKQVPEYKEYLNINADDIKTMFPEYNGTNAAFLHEESDALARRIFDMAVEARQNLVLDVTMKSLGNPGKGQNDGLAGRLEAFAAQGYEIQIQFTEVSLDTAVREVIDRYFREGRFVPPDYVRSAREQSASSKNYQTFRALRKMPFVVGWQHYTREYGEAPVFYDQGGRPRGQQRTPRG